MNHVPISRRAAAEALGTLLLVVAVIGSGIVADRLTDDAALTLFIHAVSVGGALAAVIVAIGSVSGAHLNPAVTVSVTMQRGLSWTDAAAYLTAQVIGALAGAVVSNLMFGLDPISAATSGRAGSALIIGEIVATFGLLVVIWGAVRAYPGPAVAAAVGAYIAAAVVFTSSGSFANPAVTVARTLSDTFTGISATDAPAFVAAQLTGAILATVVLSWLVPALPAVTDDAPQPRVRYRSD